MLAGMVSIANLQLALYQMPGAKGFDFSVLYPGSGGAGAGVSFASAKTALAQAAANEDKQLELAAKNPLVAKDLARYEKALFEAETIEDLLDDPIARKVFLKANGLGASVDAVVLAKRALASDPLDEESVAVKMSSINGVWLELATEYNFALFGLDVLKTETVLQDIKDKYIAEVRLDELDKQMPGLGSAILFRKSAKTFDTTIKILGSPLAREVVTTALGLPKEIALQSLSAQVKAIEQRFDVSKLQDEGYLDRLLERYLIRLNGGFGGLTV